MLPFVQVETDFVFGAAPRIGALAGIPRAFALGLSVELIAWVIPETSSEEEPPTGILLDPDAAVILEGVVGWTGEPGRLFNAWVRAGLVEKLEIGARVKGLDRYIEAWESAKRSRERAAAFRASKRTRTVPAPNANAQRTRSERTPGDGDQDVDVDPLPSEEKEERESASPPLALVAPPPEPDTPVEALRAAWNDLAPPPMPQWRETGEKRRKAARARLRDRPLSEWVEIIRRIAASDFCRGGNDRGWAAGPDFLLRPDTAAKVLEGTYDNRARAGPARDIRRGVARAEDQDHSRTEVDADGTIHF